MKALKPRNAYAIPAKLRSGAGHHPSINKYPNKQEDIEEREEEMNHKMWPPIIQAKFQRLLETLKSLNNIAQIEAIREEENNDIPSLENSRGKEEAYTTSINLLEELLKEEGLI